MKLLNDAKRYKLAYIDVNLKEEKRRKKLHIILVKFYIERCECIALVQYT